MANKEPTSIVNNALKAMLYEVTVNPKPGLVDPVSSGPHPDMNVFMFIDSAVSLRLYFQECATLGSAFDQADLRLLFSQIRSAGVRAEITMFQVTNGSNTHKGAIFSLGILVAASAYQRNNLFNSLSTVIKKMLAGLSISDFKNVNKKNETELTAGEKQYLKYGLLGIRGEAEAGYPTVTNYALPTLINSRGTINERLLDTFMTIVQNSDDTNLVKRAKTDQIIPWVHEQATKYFQLGGSRTSEGMAFLQDLNTVFLDQNLSLGGSADLLILTIFLGLQKGTL